MSPLPLRTVILGCGTIGQVHVASLQRLSNLYQVAGTADVDRRKASDVAAVFGVEASEDGLELLAAVKPEVTLIALPHLLHLEYSLAALEYGSHLLIEKPMAVSSEHCRQLNEKADSRGLQMLIGHTHQFRPHFRRAAQMIKEGAIGKIEMIFDDAADYYNFETRPKWFLDPRIAGGGALFNLVPHLIDHLFFLNNSPVTEITGKLGHLHPGAKIDTDCTAVIRFANGVCATITATVSNRLVEPRRLECRIMGTEGSLLLPSFQPEIVWFHGNRREVIDCSAAPDPIDLEWRLLHQSIVEGRRPYANGHYGERIIRTLEMIRLSSEQNRGIQDISI